MDRILITRSQDYFRGKHSGRFAGLDILSELPKVIAVDTETTGKWAYKERMFSIQIGTRTKSYLVDLESIPFKEVIPYLEGKQLVGHNLIFDLGFFYREGYFPEKVFDTFVVSRILYNNKDRIHTHNLGAVVKRELGVELDKSIQKNIHKLKLSQPKAIEYAFADVEYLLPLKDVLVKKVIANGQEKTVLLHNEWVLAQAYMEQCGLPINKKKWIEFAKRNKEELKKIDSEIIDIIVSKFPEYKDNQMDLFGGEEQKILINLNSDEQVLEVLHKFGLNPVDEKEKPSMKRDVLKKINHPLAKLLVKRSKVLNRVNAFGESFLRTYHNGRVYSNYDPLKKSARISNWKEKDDENKGAPTLTLPKTDEIRDMVEANDGFCIVSSDYEGQENVVGADLHKDKVMLDSVLNGADLHCALARVIFPELKDFDDDTIKKEYKDKRTYSKSPRFALAYGGDWRTLHINNGMTEDEAKRVEKAFRELHSGMYSWATCIMNKAIEVGYIESAWGFRIYLPDYDWFTDIRYDVENIDWDRYKRGKELYWNGDRYDDDAIYYSQMKNKVSKYFKLKDDYFKMALNIIIQSTSAHQTKLAVVWLFKYIKKRGHLWKARIALSMHDEIVLEVAEGLCDEYKRVLEDAMKKAGNVFLTSGLVEMKAEAKIGKTWKETK